MNVKTQVGSSQTTKLLLYLYWKGKGTLHQNKKHIRRRLAPQMEARFMALQKRQIV